MNRNKFDGITSVCSNLLSDYPMASKARTYLNKRLDQLTQQKFGFGFFPPQEQLNILFSFLTEEEIFETELVYEENKDLGEGQRVFLSTLSQHNLILPYRDVYGTTIALVGRSLLDDESRSSLNIPKYKNTAFKKSRHLFGLWESKQAILNKGFAYIVEGQFDCIKAHSKNITNVVALGSSNMSMEQMILLLRYTNNIKLLLDNDEAGKSGRDRIMEKYAKYTNISNVYIPGGFKDVDELLTEIDITDQAEFEYALAR
jgi:DNA primase catalytic core